MEITSPATQFLPAARSAVEKLERQIAYFKASSTPAYRILDAVSEIVIVLNTAREIVYANQGLARLFKPGEIEAALGDRPGEALGCIYAPLNNGGCGTTEFCRTCGAAQAILSAQHGKENVRECRILRGENREALDLRVRATPLEVEGERFTIFTASDISHEKRRRALERVFFHDVLNTAGGLLSVVDAIGISDPEERPEFLEILNHLSSEIIDQIRMQQEMEAAEQGDLIVTPVPLDAIQMLDEVIEGFHFMAASLGCRLVLDPESRPAALSTDRVLLKRVLGNMIKNALEASEPGGVVTLGCGAADECVSFRVHNSTYMPRHVQLQVFHRSYSTRGTGRGLGAYSMQLLTHKYLKGSISFASSPDAGTTFTASYPHVFPAEAAPACPVEALAV